MARSLLKGFDGPGADVAGGARALARYEAVLWSSFDAMAMPRLRVRALRDVVDKDIKVATIEGMCRRVSRKRYTTGPSNRS